MPLSADTIYEMVAPKLGLKSVQSRSNIHEYQDPEMQEMLHMAAVAKRFSWQQVKCELAHQAEEPVGFAQLYRVEEVRDLPRACTTTTNWRPLQSSACTLSRVAMGASEPNLQESPPNASYAGQQYRSKFKYSYGI